MADNYQYLNPTGTVVADTADLKTAIEAEWKTAFGADLIVDPSTPQGVMITAETLARSNVVKNNAALANQINPNIAGGVFLDAIMALLMQERKKPKYTLVPGVLLTGVPGTVIAAGSKAKTSAGDVFQSTTITTLDVSGNATVDFQATVAGAIGCAPTALNTIVSGVVGWETVNNASAGELGAVTQSDAGARAYRKNTLGFQGQSMPECITSALYAVESVRSISFRENVNREPQGMLVSVTGGATLSGTKWGMTTTDAAITVGSGDINFAASTQALPTINPWPVALYTTTGNVALTGLGTQAGGDWAGAMTAGQIVLVKDNTTPSQNGVWVVAAGAWARHAFNANASIIRGSNDGLQLIANSVYSCVDGGTDLDVAAALYENKSSGCAWNGGVSVNIVEPASGQTYPVQFDRPTTIGILVRVTLSGITTQEAQQAILDYADGNIEGLLGFIVGADVSPFEISGAIMAENPSCYVQKVELSLSTGSPSYSTNAIPIGLNQIAATQLSYITVIVL